MIKLRPHHLLCVRGFTGKGYSKDFIKNMAGVVSSLKNAGKVFITFDHDDICSKCPNLKNEKCISEENVRKHDSLVSRELDLEKENIYSTISLSKDIDAKRKALKRFCRGCEWFSECY